MTNKIRVTEHAILRYATRVLGATKLPLSAYDGITEAIQREIAQATPLSPMERAVFVYPQRGISPTDEYVRCHAHIYVLRCSRRKDGYQCLTVFVATTSQLATMAGIAAAHDDGNAGAARKADTERSRIHRIFLETFTTHFDIASEDKRDRLQNLITTTPKLLKHLEERRTELGRIIGQIPGRDVLCAFWAHWQNTRNALAIR